MLRYKNIMKGEYFMGSSDKIFEKSYYEQMSDSNFLCILLRKNTPIFEKDFIIEHFSNRISQMNNLVICAFLGRLEDELCQKYSNFIQKLLSSLSLDDILYILTLHLDSPIVSAFFHLHFLQNNPCYELFFVVYELKKLAKVRKSKIKEIITDEEMQGYEEIILNGFRSFSCFPQLFQIILDEYMKLLKYFPKCKNDFVKRGYLIIDDYMEKNLPLNSQMILFDGYVMKERLGIKKLRSFDFYSRTNDVIMADYSSFYHSISLNQKAIDFVYRDFSSIRIADIFILFVLGHELGHAWYDENYSKYQNKTIQNNPVKYLQIVSSLCSEKITSVLGHEYYLQNHDCFVHEYLADIFGLQTLYDRYSFFPHLSVSDKMKINQLCAQRFFYKTGCQNDFKGQYLSPVVFTQNSYDERKNQIMEKSEFLYIDELLEMIRTKQNNLTEYEKFLLGYDNSYTEILKMIADGHLKSVHLLEDILKYYDLIFHSFSESKSENIVKEKQYVKHL